MINEKIDILEKIQINLNEIKGRYTEEELGIILGAIELNSENENFNAETVGKDIILSKTNDHGAIFIQLKYDGKIEFSYALRTDEGGMVRFDGNFIKGKRASNLKYMEMIFHFDVAKQAFEARNKIKPGMVEFQKNYLTQTTNSKLKKTDGGIDGGYIYQEYFEKFGSSSKWNIVEKSKKPRAACEYNFIVPRRAFKG